MGLIGMGRMGINHLRTVLKLDAVEVVFILEPRFRSVDEIERRFDIRFVEKPKLYNELTREALDEIQQVDYCTVATPIAVHKKFAMLLADHRVPSIVEKPLSFELEDAREIIESFRIHCTPLLVGYTERFNQGARSLRKLLVEDKLIGDTIYSISTHRENPYPVNSVETGVVFDLATHDIDLIHFLSGSRYSSLESMAFGLLPEMGHKESLHVLAKLENDTIVTHSVNRVALKKRRTVEVVGSAGVAVLDLITQSVVYCPVKDKMQRHFIFSDSDPIKYDVKGYREPLTLEHSEFIDSIESHTELIEYSDIISNQQVLERISRQVELGENDRQMS